MTTGRQATLFIADPEFRRHLASRTPELQYLDVRIMIHACFYRYNTRHIALKILYLGWDYHGFAAQEDTEKTIETALFDALLKTKLIESRETSNYHRCGRTDKGVSAFGQVLLIYVLCVKLKL